MFSQASAFFSKYWKGFAISAMLAICAQFISEHYGAPAMLMALLFGIAFHFLTEENNFRPGIEFTSRTVLRIGVALLGARISVELIIGLGPRLIAIVILAVICTILFGIFLAKIMKQSFNFGLLTGGSVAICGASAAMAISAILPEDEHSERNLIFTVLSVTILSTIAMVLYPVLTQILEFDHRVSGVFLGGTIHDVAQVVGAGFSVSEETGEIATLVKLIRVAMLAPIVFIASVIIRQRTKNANASGKNVAILPAFVVGFLIFATLNSFGLIPTFLLNAMTVASKWALLISIAAVGMKTSLKRMLDVGGSAISMVIAQTIFIGIFVLVGVSFFAS